MAFTHPRFCTRAGPTTSVDFQSGTRELTKTATKTTAKSTRSEATVNPHRNHRQGLTGDPENCRHHLNHVKEKEANFDPKQFAATSGLSIAEKRGPSISRGSTAVMKGRVLEMLNSEVSVIEIWPGVQCAPSHP